MADTTQLTDDDITTEWSDAPRMTDTGPTEGEEDRDAGGEGSKDTGDEPTEADENLDVGGEGSHDTGDE